MYANTDVCTSRTMNADVILKFKKSKMLVVMATFIGYKVAGGFSTQTIDVIGYHGSSAKQAGTSKRNSKRRTKDKHSLDRRQPS